MGEPRGAGARVLALSTQDTNGQFSRIDGNDKRANYGPADFDRRHIFNFNWVYQVPKMENAGLLLGGLVNNWQISGGYRLESGLPYGLTWSINGISTRLDSVAPTPMTPWAKTCPGRPTITERRPKMLRNNQVFEL